MTASSIPAAIALVWLCIGATEVAGAGVWGRLAPTINNGEKMWMEFGTDADCSGSGTNPFPLPGEEEEAGETVGSHLTFSFRVGGQMTSFAVAKPATCSGFSHSLSGPATVSMAGGMSMTTDELAVRLNVGFGVSGGPGPLSATWSTQQIALTVKDSDVAAIQTAALGGWAKVFEDNAATGLELESEVVRAEKARVSAAESLSAAHNKVTEAAAGVDAARRKFDECRSYQRKCKPFPPSAIQFCARMTACFAEANALMTAATAKLDAAKAEATKASEALSRAEAEKAAADAAYEAYKASVETQTVAAYSSPADLLSLSSVSVVVDVTVPSVAVTVSGTMLGAALQQTYAVRPTVSAVTGAVSASLDAALQARFGQ